MGEGVQWAAWAGAGISAIASIWAFLSARKADCAATKSNRIQAGMLEGSLRDRVGSARTRVEDLGIMVSTLRAGRESDEITPEIRTQLDHMGVTLDSAVENVLNAYETACGAYLDEKVDTVRFRREYREELKNLCTREGRFAKFLQPEDQSKFRAIWATYNQWFLDKG